MKPNPSSQTQLRREKVPPIQLRTTTPPFFLLLALACFSFLPKTQAVVPAPDGGYPGFNTAEGQDALLSLDTSTGLANTAVGWLSLKSNVDGDFNTAVGAGTLVLNSGDQNTAIGAAALLLNTAGFQNTAVGSTALLNNADGNFNTATGTSALQSNTTGNFNTANGALALSSNTEGGSNTAIGTSALTDNTTGQDNTAIGGSALESNIDGSFNIALGSVALDKNMSGDLNTAIGFGAGLFIDGSGNVCIGANVSGAAGVSNTTWIRNVYPSVATERMVYVNADGKLGTLASSRRFKDEIKPMDKTSEAILALKPVTFRYKQGIDSSRIPQFGLVAEDVEKVHPDLVARDEKGEIYSVRYEAVNAMLLNEFLKQHRTVEELKKDFQATVAQQQQDIRILTARLEEQASQIQKVSALLELSKSAPRTVLNNQ